MDGLIAKIDEQGPLAWIGLMVVSFILFWPAGLVLLAFLIWSGRMGCKSRRGERGLSRWHEAWHEKKRRWQAQAGSGNHAFDEYREETIRRLEDEEREFHEFLGRLRHAKDRQEFDEFMADRRRRQESGNGNGNGNGNGDGSDDRYGSGGGDRSAPGSAPAGGIA